MSPDEIRATIADAMDIADRCHDNDQRPVVLALSALTEAVIHLADVVARDRVF